MKSFQQELHDNMSLSTKLLIVVWLLRLQSILAADNREVNSVISCQLPQSLLNEIDSYKPVVRAIMNEALNGSFKGTTWNELAYFTDTFGPRPTGSEALELSIDYVLDKSIEYELDNVHGESVTVPYWVR